MLQGCTLRQITSRHGVRYQPVFSSAHFVRNSSTKPSQSRNNLRVTRSSITLRWLIRGLGGVVSVAVAVQAWEYHKSQHKENAFMSCRLIAREPVSSTASIFHLSPDEPMNGLEKYHGAWKVGIWNFDFKQPQIQIVRAYTPLPPQMGRLGNQSSDLRFLIRHDPYGEVSSYLHRLPIGANIEIRGPNVEYTLAPDVRQVLFFAGGTGIAPALQIAHAMFDDQDKSETSVRPIKEKRLHIYWANRRREDCLGGTNDSSNFGYEQAKFSFSAILGKGRSKAVQPAGEEPGAIVRELEELKRKFPGQITVDYFVNAEGTWIDENVVHGALSRFDGDEFPQGSTSSSEQRQILISGPNGFITHLAGPKEWENGREEQGNISRLLARALSQNPHHVKVWKV